MPTVNDIKRDAILLVLGGLVSTTDDINYLEKTFWEFVLAGGLSGGGGGGGVADPLANGVVVRTGIGTSAARSIVGTPPVQVTNGSGVAGNPTLDVDVFSTTVKGVAPPSPGTTTEFLRADGTWATPAGGGGGGLPDPGINGLVARTALNTDTARTIVAGSSAVTISNGDGVAGNPSIDVDETQFLGIPEAAVTGLVADLAAKALDTTVVHLTGNETVGGIKTFSSTIAGSINGNAATVTTIPALSADVSNVGNAVTIGNGAVNNAKMANMAASTIKGNNGGVAAAPSDLTAAQVKTLLAIANTDVSGLGALATKSSVDLGTADATGTLAGARVGTFTGDVTSAGGTYSLAIGSGAVTNAKLAAAPANTLKGNNTGASATPGDLTVAQVKALLAYTPADISAVPTTRTLTAGTGLTGGGDLSADRTVAMANMAANSIKGNNTGAVAAPTDLTGTQATALLDPFTSALKGLVPASGGGTTNFLRADGVFAAPPGGGGGSLTVVTGQVNFGPNTGQDNLVTVTIPAATIGAGSFPIAFLRGTATADHDPEDYMVEGIEVVAANVVAGVSVDVIAYAPDGSFGLYDVGVAF